MDMYGNQETWITGNYEDHRNDFVAKSLMAEYAEHRERYENSPKPVKSRAVIILTEIEKQLEATESKYVSAKERLRYSKFLYDTAGSTSVSTNDYNRTDDSSLIERNSQSDISDSDLHRINEKNCDNNLASGDTGYLKEMKNTKESAQKEIEPIEQSPVYITRSLKIPSGTNIFHDIGDDNSNDSDFQKYFSEQARDGRKNFSHQDSAGNRTPDNLNHIREKLIMNDMSPRRQHPYQQHLAEYSRGLRDEFEEESRKADSPIIEQNGAFYTSEIISSVRGESKKPELHLKLSESAESLRTPMRNKKSRMDKKRRISSKIVSKSIDDTIGATTKRKIKKRGGVKTSNSRCTTATRDTSISENKKEIKKRKLKGHSIIPGVQSSQNRRQDVATMNQNIMSEVVEIYHNRAVKSGSISVVSSKHSKLMEPRARSSGAANKLDEPSRIKGSYRLVETNNPGKRICDDIEERVSEKQSYKQENKMMENCDNNYEMDRKNFQESTDFRSGKLDRTNFQAEVPADQEENKTMEEYREHHHHNRHNFQSPRNSSPCCDPLSTRNYELPTVASRLKKVNRSYFNRFHFRNIPFVVGTSVTPSYNLGLNIQETLSLMKTRQIMPAGVSRLLENNATRGIQPVTTLLDCTRDEDEAPAEESNIPYGVNSHGISNIHSGKLIGEKVSRSVQLGPFPLKNPRLSCIHDTQTLYDAQQSCVEKKIESTMKKQKTRSICSSMKFNQQKNVEPELTQSTLLRQRQEELNIGDSQSTKWQNVTQSGNDIQEVLINFHDQYEAMLSKFEKLQEQAIKTKDKSLEKEVASLEKVLNAKEKEIRAVAGLYKEVMNLKQQMRMIHERNSLVCVATESPGGPTYPHFSFHAQTANPIQMINFYRQAGSLNNNRGPPTSTRRAGLLRQIKTFQKQLKSTT